MGVTSLPSQEEVWDLPVLHRLPASQRPVQESVCPIPYIEDALDNLRDSKFYATFDLLSGYWQL